MLMTAVTMEDLQACGSLAGTGQTDASAAIKRRLEKFKLDHVRALFATKKLAYSTTLIMWVWALIGESHVQSLVQILLLIRGPQVLLSPFTTHSYHTSSRLAGQTLATVRVAPDVVLARMC